MHTTGDGATLEQSVEEIEIRGNAMHRVGDGQITETWVTWDFLGLLTQIGAVEPPTE